MNIINSIYDKDAGYLKQFYTKQMDKIARLRQINNFSIRTSHEVTFFFSFDTKFENMKYLKYQKTV